MSKAERSLFVFGLYLIAIVGVGFIFMPTFVLDTFKLSYGDDTWIRFVGLLASIIGVYYLVAARAKLQPMFIWTVYMRSYVVVFMIILLIIGKVGLSILLFAALDAAGAAWTFVSLKK
jgi:hypothetical protein